MPAMPRYRYEEDRPLSPELNGAIGALVVAWEHLE